MSRLTGKLILGVAVLVALLVSILVVRENQRTWRFVTNLDTARLCEAHTRYLAHGDMDRLYGEIIEQLDIAREDLRADHGGVLISYHRFFVEERGILLLAPGVAPPFGPHDDPSLEPLGHCAWHYVAAG